MEDPLDDRDGGADGDDGQGDGEERETGGRAGQNEAESRG